MSFLFARELSGRNNVDAEAFHRRGFILVLRRGHASRGFYRHLLDHSMAVPTWKMTEEPEDTSSFSGPVLKGCKEAAAGPSITYLLQIGKKGNGGSPRISIIFPGKQKFPLKSQKTLYIPGQNRHVVTGSLERQCLWILHKHRGRFTKRDWPMQLWRLVSPEICRLVCKRICWPFSTTPCLL